MMIAGISFFVLLFIGIPLFAQSTDSLTITSYYPSPFGAYDRLRLVPRAAITDCTGNEGLVYYDSASHSLKVCTTGTSASPVDIGGSYWTRNAATGRLYPTTIGDFVGIGTSTPTFALQIKANETLSPEPGQVSIEHPAYPGRYLIFDTTDVARIVTTNDFDLISSAGLHMRTGSDPTHDRLTIDSAGNVGIGKPNPSGRLTISPGSPPGNNDIFQVDTDSNIGLELRSGTTLGQPYIDFSNDNTSDYDMRLQLTDDDTLNFTGGNVQVEGSTVCTNTTGCQPIPHTHPANDITTGDFTEQYNVTGNMFGNVDAKTAGGIRFWFRNATGPSPTPQLCMQTLANCTTQNAVCTSDVFVRINWWPAMFKCTANCTASTCQTNLSFYSCNTRTCNGDTTACSGGTSVTTPATCISAGPECVGENGGAGCYCDYYSNANYTQEVGSVPSTYCTPTLSACTSGVCTPP